VNRRNGQDFTVHIGIPLSDDVVTGIQRAIQRAVLTELADADISRGYAVALAAPDGEDDVPEKEVPLGIWIESPDPRGDVLPA
jgi:hypothetical protein